MSILLQPVKVIQIPAQTTNFTVQGKLVIGNHNGFKIACLGPNFMAFFGEKVERPTDGFGLEVSRLLKRMGHREIIPEIGDKQKAIITLFGLHALLIKQGSGQEGILPTKNESAFIVYILDAKDTPRAVNVRWSETNCGWNFFADPTLDPNKYDTDCYVGYRK